MVSTGFSAVNGSCGTKAMRRPNNWRQALRFSASKSVVVEDDAAFRDFEARWNVAGDHPADHALAGAGLAHQSEHLAAFQLQRDVAQQVDLWPSRRAVKVRWLIAACSFSPQRSRGIERDTDPIAEQIAAQHRDDDA